MLVGNDQTICFDIDDTIILWDDKSYQLNTNGRLELVDPYDMMRTNHIVHDRHVKFLKRCHARGFSVVLWSSSGAEWAATVGRALGLEPFVLVALTKPTKVVDDLKNTNEIIPEPMFLNIEGFSR
jgi:hypothetical protein